jgi:hypothetical protein
LALLPHSCLLASEHRYETVNYWSDFRPVN